MSARKERREIDKAIGHLIEYEGPHNEWAGRLKELDQAELGFWEVTAVKPGVHVYPYYSPQILVTCNMSQRY